MLRFTFELALRLGMLHADLMERISGQEIAYWRAFFEMHTEDSWLQAATVASAAANAFGKGPPPSAYLPRKRKPPVTQEQLDAETEDAFWRS